MEKNMRTNLTIFFGGGGRLQETFTNKKKNPSVNQVIFLLENGQPSRTLLWDTFGP